MRIRRIKILLIIFFALYLGNLIIENNFIGNKNNDNDLNDYNRNDISTSSSSPPLKYEWVYNSGVDEYYGAIEIDSEENIYICANNYLIKLNSFGIQLWNQTTPDVDFYAYDMVLDSNEDILIVGATSRSMDTKLLKFNSSGNLQWSQTFERRYIGLCNLAIDSLDNLYVGADVQNVGAGFTDLYLAKFNSSGGLLWETWWGTPIFEWCYDITIDSSGNIYLAGFNQIIATTTKSIILVKFNNLGDFVWNREWNRNSLDESHAIGLDSLGNIWLAGFTRITGSNHDFVLLKYDTSGSLLLDEIWGTNNNEKCYAMDIDPQDNLYLSGNYLVKFDKFGIKKWDASFSTIDLIKSRKIKLDNSGNLFLFGSSSSSTLDVCVVKTNLLPLIVINSPASYDLFGNYTPEFNITIDEPFLNSTWYNLNGGQNYTFSGSTGLINQTAWDSCGNGTVAINFYANNTWVYEGYQEIVVRKDISNPNITILSPESYQLYGNATFGFTLSFLEPNLDKAWYSLNGGNNYTFSGSSGTINQDAWDTCGNGTVTTRFYANDTVGNVGFEEVIVRKDESIPELIIYSPTSYQLFGNETISFELFLNKPNLNSTWYSLNSGKNYTFSGSNGIIDQAAWDTCGNGTVTIRFYTNDSIGDTVFEEVIVRKDTHIPLITINNPTLYQLFSTTSPTFQISIGEISLNTTWYRLDSIPQTFDFTGNSGIINQTAWDSLGSGNITITFYANNSLGNIGYEEIIVEKDVTAPIINIDSPISYQVFGFNSPYFSLTINEPNLNSSWYIVSGFAEKFFFSATTGKINQSIWDLFGNGTVSVTFYSNDSFGYQNSESITIRKDIINPEITIITPKLNQLFGVSAPSFELSISEPNLDKTWYSVNNGLNYTFTGTIDQINQAEWDLYGDGEILLTFYVNDTVGNLISKNMVVRKDHTYVIYILSTPISIDDLNPSINWAKTASDYPWCSGSGTWSDPYLIRGVVMTLSGSNNCILIQNSQVYFKIQDSILSGGSGSSTSGGIKLINVSNSLLIWNDVSDNTNGIILTTDSDNNTIHENFVNNNYWHGILIQQNSDDNNITNNIGKYNSNGLLMRGTSIGNKIISNNFSNNTYISNILYGTGHGIIVYNGCNRTIIIGNLIMNNTFEGIYLGSYCYDSEISFNLINYNGYAIEIGGWSENSIIKGNEIIKNRLGGIEVNTNPRVEIVSNKIIDNGGTGLKIWSNSDYCTVRDNLIIDNSNFGIDLGQSVDCDYNTIYNNTFIGNGQNAREYDWGSNNKWYYGTLGNFWDDYTGEDIDGNGIGDTPYDVPEVPSGNNQWDNFPIYHFTFLFIDDARSNNWIWAKANGFVTGSGIYSDPYIIKDLVINDKTLGYMNRINYKDGIIIRNSNSYFKLLNCSITNLERTAISFIDTRNGYVNNNNFSYNGLNGILMNNCDNTTISTNIISNNGNHGIDITYSDNTIFSTNIISHNGNRGIDIDYSNNDYFNNNIVQFNVEDDIRCGYSSYLTFKNNIVKNIASLHYSFYLWDSDYCTIENNSISGQWTGIKLQHDSDYNNIIDNYVNPGYYGILIGHFDDNNNRVYKNKVVGATTYAYDQGFSNNWDNGLIGNYWGNYGGIDANDDGIGDSPYSIPGTAGNQDRFPIWDDGENGLPPDLTIISPTQNVAFNMISPNFTVSINELYIHTTWYQLIGGSKNYTFSGNSGMINQTLWDEFGNGLIILRVFANDTSGNIGYDEVLILKDILEPEIFIISPLPFDLYGINPASFSVFINDTNLDTMWYSLDEGLTEITILINGTFDSNEWGKLQNGTIDIRFYANDSAGNIGLKIVTIRIDIILPEIIIISPQSNELFGANAPGFEVSFNDPNLNTTWYFLDGKSYIFTENETINQFAWDSYANGTVLISFYANDSVGNIAYQEIVLQKDILAPIIDIIEPVDNKFYALNAPQFNLSINDGNLDSIWYTLGGGNINITCYALLGIINQTEWDKINDGIVVFKVYANDTLGNLEFSEVIIYKDIIAPIISANSPVPDQLYGIQAPTFNINITELNLQEKWYSLNGGQNITFTTQTQFNQSEWNNVGNGTVLITFYAIDVAGNINFSEILIRKDAYMPDISILSPLENDFFGETALNFNVEIFDSNLDMMWYSLDGGVTNTTFTFNTAVDQNLWDLLNDGTITLSFYANDTAGNLNFKLVNIMKDSTNPIITIIIPNDNDVYGTEAPAFEILIDETNLESLFYSLDGGITNISISGLSGNINQNLWDNKLEGEVYLTFYALDEAGNKGIESVVVIKRSPTQTSIPGYDILLLIGAISVVSIILMVKQKRKKPF